MSHTSESPTHENFDSPAGPSALPQRTPSNPKSRYNNDGTGATKDDGIRQRKVTVDDATWDQPRRKSGGLPATQRRDSASQISMLKRAVTLVVPEKKIGPEPTIRESLMACVKASWLNVLLVFIPVSWALHFALDHSKSSSDTIIFVTCFLAIIPLAKLLAFGTEELAIRVGQTLGGLLNATLGNVVELIVGIIALAQCKLRVVQASLVGSILSNLLLVLGMCFFAGGTRFSEQGFMQTAAQLNTSLLILSVTAILIPAGFKIAIDSLPSGSDVDPAHDVLKMSHGVAIVLLIIYGCTLVFQLWTHAHLYQEDGKYSAPAADSIEYPPNEPKVNVRLSKVFNKIAHPSGSGGKKVEEKNDAQLTISTTDIEAQTSSDEPPVKNTPSEDVEIPRLRPSVAFALLVIVAVLVAITAEFLVSSIDGLTKSGNIGEEWVGLILLPIVGNAAEHVTAVTVSVKDKLDLSIGVAVGSSIQIALFVIPLLVILGWIMGKPLTLLFDLFECFVLFLAVLTVAFVINDGRSNWMEGMILMSLYVIVATAFWFYPASTGSTCAVSI